jgi:hypothetical protein
MRWEDGNREEGTSVKLLDGVNEKIHVLEIAYVAYVASRRCLVRPLYHAIHDLTNKFVNGVEVVDFLTASSPPPISAPSLQPSRLD